MHVVRGLSEPSTLTKTCAYFRSGVTSTWFTVTSTSSKVISRMSKRAQLALEEFVNAK